MLVTPDLTGFAEEVRRRLAEDMRDVRVSVGVDVDAGDLRYRLAATVQRAARGLAARIAVDLRTTQLRADVVAAIRAATAGLQIVVPVRADTRGLRAEVGRAVLGAGAGRHIDIPVRTNVSDLLPSLRAAKVGLVAAAAGLGTPIVAAIEQAVAASAGALATLPAFVALAAQSVGVLGLAFSGVGTALKAFTADQGKAAAAATAGASAQKAAASAAASAADSVTAARERLGDAYRQAGRGVEQADRQLVASERQLVGAQLDARRAQEGLTQAREDATQQIADLRKETERSGLTERKALLDKAEAKRSLDAVMADTSASELQREAARISYEEASNNLDDTKDRIARNAAEYAEASREGVDGQDAVVTAQRRVQDSAVAVGDAQREVADSQRAVSDAQRDGAQAVASAQRELTAALRRQGEVAESAASAGTAGANTYAAALAKLPPLTRAFVGYLISLGPAMTRLKVASSAVFPGMRDALEGLVSNLPVVEAGLGRTAEGISRVGTASGSWYGSPAFSGDLAGVMNANAVSTENFAFAGLSLTQMLWDTVAVGAPLVQMLSASARGSAENVRQWVAAKRESGELSAWMTRGVAQVGQLVRIVVDLGMGVHNTLGAVSAGSGDVVGGIERMSASFRRASGSEVYQARVSGAFAAVREAAAATAGGVRSAVGDIVTGFQQGATAAGATGLEAVFQGVGAKARSFADVVRDDMLPAVERVWPVLSTKIIPKMVELGGVVSSITNAALGALFELVSTYGPPVLGGLAFVLGLLIPPLSALAGWLESNHTLIGAVATAVAVVVVPVLAAVLAFRTVVGVMALASRAIAALQFAWWLLNLAFAISPIGLIVVGIIALVAALVFAYKNSEQFRQVVDAAFRGVWNIVKIVGAAFADFGRWAAGVFTSTADRASGFLGFFTTIWRGGFDLVVGITRGAITAVRGAIEIPLNALKLAFNLWFTAVTTIFRVGFAVVQGVVRFFVAIFTGDWAGAWAAVRDTTTKILGIVSGAIDRGLVAIKGFFSGAVSGIRTIWDGLREIAAAPVRFVVNTVYNNGIRKAWNFVASKVGLPELGELRVPGLAAGGPVTGGTPGRDSVLRRLMPGEHVLTTAEVDAFGGHGAVFALRRALGGGRQSKGPAMGFGGWVSGAWDATGGKAVTALADAALGALATGLEAAFSPIRSAMDSAMGRDEDWSGGANRLMQKPMDAAVATVRRDEEETVTSSAGSGGGGGAGVEQWRGVALQALALAGQPASWIGLLLKRMNQESGGNERAINLWDSNAKAGNPSQGLMQTVPGTFNAYAGALRGRGILDPLANIFASINYTQSRYGTLQAWSRPGGYAKGGTPPLGQPFWVGEEGPELMAFGGRDRATVTPGPKAGGVTNHFHMDRSMSTPEVLAEMRRQLSLALSR